MRGSPLTVTGHVRRALEALSEDQATGFTRAQHITNSDQQKKALMHNKALYAERTWSFSQFRDWLEYHHPDVAPGAVLAEVRDVVRRHVVALQHFWVDVHRYAFELIAFDVVLDPSLESIDMIRMLSDSDFPNSGVRVAQDGTIAAR